MSNSNKTTTVGYLCALGATAIWSGNFIVARGLSDALPPISLAFFRWVTAVLVFMPIAIPILIREWPEVRRNLRYITITAFLGITCFNTFVYVAGHTTTAMNLSLIAITFPVFIILISAIVFAEKISLRQVAGVCMVLAGVVYLITKGDLGVLRTITFAPGDIWMLCAAVIFAVFTILLKRKPSGLNILAFQFMLFATGLILLAPAFVWEQLHGNGNYLNANTIPAILYVGIFASLCAFLLWNRAIIILGPSKAGMVYYMLPIFGGLLAWLFLGESVGMVHWISMVLVISGILIANLSGREN